MVLHRTSYQQGYFIEKSWSLIANKSAGIINPDTTILYELMIIPKAFALLETKLYFEETSMMRHYLLW